VTYAVTRAIKIAPDLPEALIGYAQVLSAKGDHAVAAEYLEKCVQEQPADWMLRFRLVNEYQAAGQPEQAARVLFDLKCVFPNDPEICKREAALEAHMPRPEAVPGPEQPKRGSAAAGTLALLLEAEDLPAALVEHHHRLDGELLELVRANARAARADGDPDLAEGLEYLAAYVDQAIAATRPASPSIRAAETLTMLLDADDLPAALLEHRNLLDSDLLALVRRDATAARAEGDGELAEGLDDLAEYVAETLSASQPV
jgi:tetratricopeptide (TPR) repeat protein